MARSRRVNTHYVLFAFVFLTVLWLLSDSRNMTTLQSNVPYTSNNVHHPQERSSLQLPIRPTLVSDNTVVKNTVTEFLTHTTEIGGWINVNSLEYESIKQLRDSAQTIMSRNINCGRPKVFGKEIATDLEYCFWDNDYVSGASLRDFAFEKFLVDWVFRDIRDLDKTIQQYSLNTSECSLGILDVGVNVGDWAAQLVAALPTIPFFGIEGTISTSIIATANMLTSIEDRIRSNKPSATAMLLLFALMSKNMVDTVQADGGICFWDEPDNVGGQGIKSDRPKVCKPHLMAGATLMSNALKSIATVQSCPGKQDWPRIYLAKIDIQTFEFKVITEALTWLHKRPPCYIMIEVDALPAPQTYGLFELLLDAGYDSVWRTHNPYSMGDASKIFEFPPDAPYWKKSSSKTLYQAAGDDMNGQDRDYLFGFQDKEKCICQLME